ncbi:helix-turn-helix domain-containing protein [Paenibacillus sp. HW567]|uniref:helix-turn-helix domain-containing protein n=1 Tax=Paenibacillus sp. HW567 TaxID=1034769 RepID=UPI000688522C|nr:helix-turn-helix domain-containing protein [Paenibacillus sp. HW567]
MVSSSEWTAEWVSRKPLTRQWMVAGEVHFFQRPALIMITDGQSIWSINGHRVQVSFAQLIAVEEDSVIEVIDGEAPDLAGWQIQFNTYTLFGGERETGKVEWKVPAGNSFQQVQLTSLDLAGLGHYLREAAALDVIQKRIGNQALVYELLKHIYREQPHGDHSMGEGLLRSVTYMQEHYNEMITRNQLAQIAGVSPWYYSRKFNERYGVAPLSYLSQYRVYRAQEQLLLTSATSQKVARQVGFEDVHYFSRRFKQFTGVSPRNYVQTLSQRKMVVLNPLCAEIMIELGVIPHAVVVPPLLLAEHQREQFIHHQVEILDTPQFNLDVERISHAEPELIIGTFITENKKQKLHTIAPIIADMPSNLEAQLNALAALFRKDKEARSIREHLDHQLDEARKQLDSLIHSVTVMVLRIEPFGYRYMGGCSNGMSNVLYGQLQLTLPEPLRTGKAWFNSCSVELLGNANPDYLFVEKRVMEHFDAEEQIRELMESSEWRQLKAVKNNRVFYIDTRLWVDGCGVLGYPIILDQIVRCLTGADEEKCYAQ